MTSAGAYVGSVALVDPPAAVAIRASAQLAVRIVNESDEWWPAGDRPQRRIRVAWRWRNTATDRIAHAGRHLLTETVRPGDASLQVLSVRTPVRPGSYTLDLRLLHEHVRWFGDPVATPIAVQGPAEAPLFRVDP